MSKVRALSAGEAKRTLVNRLGTRVVDRARQIATNKGLRPYRVALVWTVWSGDERGEGTEKEIARLEILPTPKVISLDAVAMSPQAAGMIPMGSVRIEKVSVGYTLDQLKGRMVPVAHEQHVPDTYSFFYEIKEDGRGDKDPEIMRFRLAADPFRKSLSWVMNLERIELTSEKA